MSVIWKYEKKPRMSKIDLSKPTNHWILRVKREIIKISEPKSVEQRRKLLFCLLFLKKVHIVSAKLLEKSALLHIFSETICAENVLHCLAKHNCQRMQKNCRAEKKLVIVWIYYLMFLGASDDWGPIRARALCCVEFGI